MTKAIVVKDRVDTEPAVVLSVKEADDVRRQLLSLREQSELQSLEIADLLFKAKNGVVDGIPAFARWGFKSFNDYCERELKVAFKKGYFLLDVRAAVQSGILTEKVVKEVGISRAYQLGGLAKKGVVTKENVGKWVDAVKDLNVDEVRETVKNAVEKKDAEDKAGGKKTAKGGGVEPEIFKTYRYGLPLEIAKDWEQAMEKASRLTNGAKDPFLVDCIAMHFISAEAVNTKEQSVHEMCKRLERVFREHHVGIAAFDMKKKTVLYGSKVLKEMAEEEK